MLDLFRRAAVSLRASWAVAPRWAIWAGLLALAVVLAAAAVGDDEGMVWLGTVKLAGAVLAIAAFLVVVRLVNSVSANSFDAAFARALETPLGQLGVMVYYGLRIVAVAHFLGAVLRW